MKTKRLLLFSLLFFQFIQQYANTPEESQQSQEPAHTYLSILLNKVKLSGYGHLGYVYNSNELKEGKKYGASTNTFEMRRFIFMAEAEVVRNLTAFFMYDFVGSKTHEYWGEYAFNKALKIRLGQFKTPFSIENPISMATVEVINGAQAVQYLTGITGADICYGGKAGRDLGLMLHGSFLNYRSHHFLSYNLGIFNGQGINTRDLNNRKDIAGTLRLHPLEEVSIVGTFYIGQGHALADNPFGAFRKGDNYTRNRWSAGTEIKTQPLYFRAEYLRGKDGNVESEGYYAIANYHVLPKIDLIASYDYFNPNIDSDPAQSALSKQTNYIIGAQWNFYRRCRLQLQYVFQERGKGWENSNLVMSQFQIVF